MRRDFKKNKAAGFSLIEVIVASVVMLLVFSGLMGGIQLMVSTIGQSKAQAGARSLALLQLEYIRSLDYEEVGTVAGIPSGNIPQYSTTTLNGITYVSRVLIQYLDRDEDGFGVSDSNGITEDSKRVKIEFTWTVKEQTDLLTIISDIVPVGMESTSGGGTLLINVFDASILPVEGAEVHVFNASVATDTIDVTVNTNAAGIANFPGAPARAGYQITVTKPGYSTDQTYSASTTNPSPNPAHVSVAAGLVSTMYFSIDLLSDLTIRTISTPVRVLFTDSFTDADDVASTTDTTISSGAIVLTDSGGVYDLAGTAFSTSTVPTTISAWESFDFNGTSSVNTEYRVSLYVPSLVGSSTLYTLVPDGDLANNSLGFISGPVDITDLDPVTYPELVLGATLTTNDNGETPSLYDWSLTYVESESPISGVDFSFAGSKSIGNNAGVPVLKYTSSGTTDGNGEIELTDIEWDAYDVTLNGAVEGYNISETDVPTPYALQPDVSDILTITLEPYSAYSLRVTVLDTLDDVIPGASVRLYNGGFDSTTETSIYGQVYFTGMASSTDYNLDVTATGYDPEAQTNISITGNMETEVVLALEGTGGGTTTPPTPPPPSNFLAGYDSRIPVSISGSSLFSTVSDFPVYLNLASLPSGFFSDVQSDGDDIRITQSNGQTEVPFQLVNINTGAQTGQLHFKAPSLSISTTTVFYVYYGSSTASAYLPTATYGRNNVWTNNFLAVYHLEEAQAGSGNAGLYVDSTGNGYNGTDNIDATGKTGKIGSGQEFDNAFTDNVSLPYTLLNGRTDVTLSFWYRTNTDDYMSVLSGARSGEANEYLLWFQDYNDIQFFSHGDPRVNFDISSVNDDVWRHYVSVRDDTNNQTRLYINSSEDNQSPTTDSMSALSIASGGLFIGVDQDSVGGSFDQELDGELDEVRISSGVRSSGWISNEYANQNTPSSFYSVGAIETE